MQDEYSLLEEHFLHGRIEQARALVNHLLGEDSLQMQARVMDARIDLMQGELETAIEKLEDLMIDVPGIPEPLIVLAECMLHKGEQGQALAFARKALSWGGGGAFLNWLLGNEALEQQDDDVALGHFEEALAIDSSHVDSWLGKGGALKALGRLADAEDALIRAVQAGPGRVDSWVALIRLETEAGVHDIAADNLHLALRSHPGNPKLLQLKSENRDPYADDFSIGLDVLCQTIYDENWSRMEEVLDSLVLSHFDHPRLIVAKAEAFLATEEGKPNELIHALNRYLRNELQDWWARAVLGRLLLRESAMQNPPLAVAHCEDAWRVSGEHPHAGIGLVEAWASLGKNVYAKALCEKLAQGNGRESVKAKAILEGRIP
jgi:tetratricopeptide (TPR) repeat protein